MTDYLRNDSEIAEARAHLVVATVVVFVLVWLVAGIATGSIGEGLFLALLITTLWVLLGAVAVRISEALHEWGTPTEYTSWSVARRLRGGMFWPALLVYWLVVAVFSNVLMSVYGSGAETKTPKDSPPRDNDEK